MIAGYDPHRIPALRWHTMSALGGLDALSSSDPAAVDAISAVRNLHRALDSDLLPAVHAIEIADPLTRAPLWHAPRVAAPASRPRVDRHTQWFEGTPSSTQFSDRLLGDLFVLARIEMTRLLDEHGGPAFDDPFWAEDFPDLVAEFERRVANDPEIAAALVAEAAFNPMVGLIIGAGNFDAHTVVAVTNATLRIELTGTRNDLFVNEAVSTLLSNLVDDPAAALALLTQPDTIDVLFGWNLRFHGGGDLPSELLADLIINALLIAPEVEPDLVGDVAGVLAEFVRTAEHLEFGDPRDGEVASALAIVFAAHGPHVLASLVTYCNIQMRHGDAVTHLGTHDEVADFLAQLVGDPIARAVLTSMVHDLASHAEPGSTGPTPQQISALGVLLDAALDAENDRLGAEADAAIARIDFGTTLASFLSSRALSASGLGAFASFVVKLGVGAVGDHVADRVTPGTVGAPAFDVLTDLIIEMELLRDAIDDPAQRRPTATPADVAAARTALATLDALIADGPTPFHEIERHMIELRSTANLVTGPVNFTPYRQREIDASDHPCDDAHLAGLLDHDDPDQRG